MEFDIIIVDDNDVDLMLLNRVVDKVFPNHTIKPYLSGLSALDEIFENSSLKNRIIVLLDINMPEYSGWDFLEMIEGKILEKQVKICIVTSSVNISDKKRAQNFKNVIALLEKPITLKDLENLKNTLQWD